MNNSVKESEANALIKKGVDNKTLSHELNKLRSKYNNEELVDENVKFNDEKPTILYVDDNKDLIENMSDYFTDNYNIYTATKSRVFC
jgi:PleD family two-component response regulator